MKRIILSLIALSAVVVLAQDEVVQSGTPALLETTNGKQARVMLQKLEDGKLTFQAGSRSMTVPADKVSSLTFSMSKEDFDFYREQKIISEDQVAEIFKKENISREEKLGLIFKEVLKNISQCYGEGDFQKVIDSISPVINQYFQYMPIDNNMREQFVLLYNAYRFSGDYENAQLYADMLIACGDEEMEMKGKAGLALVAIEKEDFATAEAYQAELAEKSEAAGLYLQAALQRAKGDPKRAIQTVTVIIEDHANDLEWLPASELLSAYCYLDLTGTNSVISTNSAMNTARQVKNMYAGSAVAADAKKLWTSLGGPEVEALAEAERAERAAAVKAAKERIAAEQKAKKEAKAAEKAAAKAAAEAAAAAQESGVSTNTVTESESE